MNRKLFVLTVLITSAFIAGLALVASSPAAPRPAANAAAPNSHVRALAATQGNDVDLFGAFPVQRYIRASCSALSSSGPNYGDPEWETERRVDGVGALSVTLGGTHQSLDRAVSCHAQSSVNSNVTLSGTDLSVTSSDSSSAGATSTASVLTGSVDTGSSLGQIVFTVNTPATYSISVTYGGTGQATPACCAGSETNGGPGHASTTLLSCTPNLPYCAADTTTPILDLKDSGAQSCGSLAPGNYLFRWDTQSFAVIAYTPGTVSSSVSYSVNFHVAAAGSGGGDADGDGLPDCWEKNGLDADGDGAVDLDLPGMGADPRHKDVFVELDHMFFHPISNDALRIVVDSFAAAPVANPDGSTGIILHVDNGPGSLMNPLTGATWGSRSEADSIPELNPLGTFNASRDYDWSAFQILKDTLFSSPRRPVFHYALSVHDFDPVNQNAGISRNATATFDAGASDFLISLGGACTADPCTPPLGMQAGTFMHELGHNLGLHHGGNVDDNFKPNYFSIMNYAFIFSGLKASGTPGRYDYSRYGSGALSSLDETNLAESAGVSPTDPGLAGFLTIWTCPDGSKQSFVIATSIDWDCDFTVANTAADVNGDGMRTTLQPAEDWRRLVFTGGGIGSLGAPLLPMSTSNFEPPLAEALSYARVLDPENFGGGGDTTPPVVVGVPDRAPNAAGWYGADVTIDWQATDDGGSATDPPDTVASAEGANVVYTSGSSCDPSGNCATGSLTLSIDMAAPVVTVPADMTVDATGPSGASVSYSASASDLVDPSPGLVCAPASGSLVPIGTTEVTCTATDAAGNSANAAFNALVRGAAAQIVRLIDKTLAFLDLPALRAALRTRLEAVASALVAKNASAACKGLKLYIAAVKIAPTSALSAAEKTELVADATRIRAVIGCA